MKKLKLSELRKIIRETILSEAKLEIVNNDTGAIIDTLTMADAKNMSSLRGMQTTDGMMFLDDDEFEHLEDEIARNILAKTNTSSLKDERESLENILTMAKEAGYDWGSDKNNLELDAEDYANDAVDSLTWEDDFIEALAAVADDLTDKELESEDPSDALVLMLKSSFIEAAQDAQSDMS